MYEPNFIVKPINPFIQNRIFSNLKTIIAESNNGKKDILYHFEKMLSRENFRFSSDKYGMDFIAVHTNPISHDRINCELIVGIVSDEDEKLVDETIIRKIQDSIEDFSCDRTDDCDNCLKVCLRSKYCVRIIATKTLLSRNAYKLLKELPYKGGVHVITSATLNRCLICGKIIAPEWEFCFDCFSKRAKISQFV